MHLNAAACDLNVENYFYAALELRFLIEHVLSDTIRAVSREKLSQTQAKQYRAKDLTNTLSRVCPDFEPRWKFLGKVVKLQMPEVEVPIIELHKLNRIYGSLGAYLHRPMTEFSVIRDNDWKDRLESTVLVAFETLGLLCGPLPAPQSFTPGLESLYADLCEGSISDEEFKRRAYKERVEVT
ncbi:MAG: hypothetical protein GY941_01125 [Planctomycetes bacterium]|nr:hypothetical protein [Planctomycetota bacterium]